jgi:hypothetical protein
MVAYEALCRKGENVVSFLTLGSPLGIPRENPRFRLDFARVRLKLTDWELVFSIGEGWLRRRPNRLASEGDGPPKRSKVIVSE